MIVLPTGEVARRDGGDGVFLLNLSIDLTILSDFAKDTDSPFLPLGEGDAFIKKKLQNSHSIVLLFCILFRHAVS